MNKFFEYLNDVDKSWNEINEKEMLLWRWTEQNAR
jgi:hypothetical protein